MTLRRLPRAITNNFIVPTLRVISRPLGNNRINTQTMFPNMNRLSFFTPHTVRRNIRNLFKRIFSKNVREGTVIINRPLVVRLNSNTPIFMTPPANLSDPIASKRNKIKSSTLQIRKRRGTRANTLKTNARKIIRKRRPKEWFFRTSPIIKTNVIAKRNPLFTIRRVRHRRATKRTNNNFRQINRPTNSILPSSRAICRSFSNIFFILFRISKFRRIMRSTIRPCPYVTKFTNLLRLLRVLTFTSPSSKNRRVSTNTLQRYRRTISSFIRHLLTSLPSTRQTIKCASTNMRRPRVIGRFHRHTRNKTKIFKYNFLISKSNKKRTLSVIRVQLIRLPRRLTNMTKRTLRVTALPLNMSNIRNREKFTQTKRTNRRSRLIPKRFRVSIFRVVNTNALSGSFVNRKCDLLGSRVSARALCPRGFVGTAILPRGFNLQRAFAVFSLRVLPAFSHAFAFTNKYTGVKRGEKLSCKRDMCLRQPIS